MPDDRLELVHREYRAFTTRDWPALSEVWHPEIVYEVVSGGGTFRGIEEITQFFDAYFSPFARYEVEAEEIVERGEKVIAVERHAGGGLMGSEKGEAVKETFARLITFKDGRIWHVKEFRTLDEALEAADLPAALG